MKSIRSLMKGNMESTAGYAIFAVVAVYVLFKKQPETVGLGAGVALILYVLTGGNVLVSAVLGSIVSLVALYYSRTPMVKVEGFSDERDELSEEDYLTDKENMKRELAGQPGAKEGFDEEEEEKPKKKAVKKAKRANPPPDNGDRAEFLTLGKKYKMPSEGDDQDFHLDAGTTFMNAYKSLKPDQIAAMTKDTQDLMTTQKQLMSTLQTLKPLIKDGKEMMDMFQGYFGAGTPTTV